jgi:hypothetical protein
MMKEKYFLYNRFLICENITYELLDGSHEESCHRGLEDVEFKVIVLHQPVDDGFVPVFFGATEIEGHIIISGASLRIISIVSIYGSGSARA